MYRFCFILAVLVIASTSAAARNVHQGRSDLSSESNEGDTNSTTTLASTTTAAMEDTTHATTAETTTAPMTTEKLLFRKRRGANSIAESTKSKSSGSSEESEGSGDGSSSQISLVDPNEGLLNVSESNGTSIAASSDESGSGEEATPIDASSNEVPDPKPAETQTLGQLKKKLQIWQNSVDNYLYNKNERRRRRRKRQQAPWSQFFPIPGSPVASSSKGSNSVFSAASDAVGDALKPAMDLMTQGVGLLGDLYSTHLTRSTAFTGSAFDQSNSTNTDTSDQFRNHLRTLQWKLGDLGEQLRRVVNSFQHMQVPLLDNIMSGGTFSLGDSSLTSVFDSDAKPKSDKDV